jgi:hypothetical protein
MKYGRYTIGIPGVGELFEFDAARSRQLAPYLSLVLSRPLVTNPLSNPLLQAVKGARFAVVVVRRYDNGGSLLRSVEYSDVFVQNVIDGPDLIVEFRYGSAKEVGT